MAVYKTSKDCNQPTHFLIQQIPSSFIVAKADRGATKHYFCLQDTPCLKNIHPIDGPSVFLPNMESIKTTHQGSLPFEELSSTALAANILPNLHSASLTSLGQLCDDDCDVWLNKHLINVFQNHLRILQGERNPQDRLWDFHIPIQFPPLQNKHNLAVIIQNWLVNISAPPSLFIMAI